MFFLVMLLLSTTASMAQMDYYNTIFARQRDSLINLLDKHSAQDTGRANKIMNLLDCAIFLSQRKQLLPWWQEGLALSRSLKYKRAEVDLLEWRGSYYKSAQQQDSSFLYLDSAIALAGNSTDEWMGAAKGFAQFEKGMIYEFQENFYTALNNYFGALKTYNGSDLRKQKMISLRIADIYKKLHNDDKALEYYEAALNFFEEDKGPKPAVDAEGICTCIAGIYFNRGNLQKAGYYLYKLKSLMPDTVETMETGGYYHLAGQIALRENKTDSSIYLLKQALKYFDYTKETHADDIGSASADLARLQMEKGNVTEAKKYVDLSMAAAKQSDHKEAIANALEVMAAYYNITGNPAEAYRALNKATLLNDSLLAESNVKQAGTLAAIYESGKKEKEIAQLETDKKIQSASVKQKSLLNTIFIIAIVALLIISLVSYLNFKNKQKIEQQKIAELEKEKQLTGIEAMLKGEETERSRLAKDLHDGLGGMLSGVRMSFSTMKENMVMNAMGGAIFEKSLQQLDSTIVELRKVAHNMMPEALVKYGLRSAVVDFCESMQLSGNTKIICEQFGDDRELGDIAGVNVYRIIQELVNNSIVHGKAAQILVQLSITAGKVLITVEDDGNGFDQHSTEKVHGIGLTNIQYRVNYFNGKVEIVSKPGEGTTVNIELMA
ncbi:MAG: ATP-binding protein [Bacteroidota bacterium]